MQVEDERKDGLFKRISESSAVKKIKSAKNIQIIAVIFIIAIGLIIYSSVMTSRSGSESVSSAMTQEEERLSAVLGKIEGAGNVEAMITSRDGEVVGVLIVATGADSITVRVKLIDAAATALGVDRRLINVYGRAR